MPKVGTRKLYHYLQPELERHSIKIGRDALFRLLRHNDLLVKKTKRFHITTDSKHSFFKSPNLLKDTTVTHSEQAFVCDITYIKTDNGHNYLALVTDAYSKKIMGYHLDHNMKVSLVKNALKMAKDNTVFNPNNIILHSDRGIQYCAPEYTEFALKNGFILSTTQKYDPYENAIAERINGILKYEFGLGKSLPNLIVAKAMIKQAVRIYNNFRVHWSLRLKTPNQVHNNYNKDPVISYKKSS